MHPRYAKLKKLSEGLLKTPLALNLERSMPSSRFARFTLRILRPACRKAERRYVWSLGSGGLRFRLVLSEDLQIVLRSVYDLAGVLGVPLTLPLGDEDRGDGVTANVGQSTAFAHELVDPEDQHDPRDRNRPHRRERRCQHDEARSGYPGRPLRGEQEYPEDAQLLPDGQVHVLSLRNEDRGKAQIDRGAVEVERVARRHHESDYRLGGSEVFKLLHQLRQHRL